MLLIILGLTAGFLSASLGIGGGIIFVPALVLVSKFEIKKAIGTSLSAAAPTVLVGSLTHYIIEKANPKLFIALFIIAGSVVGVKLGVSLVNKMSSRKLKILFAVLLLFAGLKLAGIIKIPTGEVSQEIMHPMLVVLGLFVGSSSALFGIGGGIVMVPCLNLFFGLGIHEAIATSLVVIFPTVIVGALLHKNFNNVDLSALKYLIPTALTGAVLGAITANSLPEDTLKVIFGILLVFSSVKMILDRGRGQ